MAQAFNVVSELPYRRRKSRPLTARGAVLAASFLVVGMAFLDAAIGRSAGPKAVLWLSLAAVSLLGLVALIYAGLGWRSGRTTEPQLIARRRAF